MTETTSTIRRSGGRGVDELRPVSIELGPMKFADGSALIEMGDTRVLVAATLEKKVPPFLLGSDKGWATAEYAMLPAATPTRSRREVTRGKPSGRSSEIQRLIGRSLRAVLDLKALCEHTLTLDCDVLQADGGTRTAAITGAYVAAGQALARALLQGDLARWPFVGQVAAITDDDVLATSRATKTLGGLDPHVAASLDVRGVPATIGRFVVDPHDRQLAADLGHIPATDLNVCFSHNRHESGKKGLYTSGLMHRRFIESTASARLNCR